MVCNLLSTPVELLVQHILARLDLLTLRSCSSSCKRLNLTIKDSPLLRYLIKLQEMNLIDNPAVSYNTIPLARRLEMLREYGGQEVKWAASADVNLGGTRWIEPGEAGVLYVPPMNEFDTQELHWTILPSKLGQTIKWDILRPSNPSAVIVAHTLSIEENDLIALVTRHEEPHPIPGNRSLFRILIHLIQHSTQRPYPGLAPSILDICAFQRSVCDYPIVNLAIRGTNLAVMVGHGLQEIHDPSTWAGQLTVWNWKTGEKKCGKKCRDKDSSLVFLTEDILLHGSSLSLSLDIYHIPKSAPSAGDHDNLPLIECLGLPKLKTELYDPEFAANVSMSFRGNPAAIPSFTEFSDPTVPRLFAADDLCSILPIKVMFEEYPDCTYYLFITHYRTLLGRAKRALSLYKNGQDVATTVPWEEWGPNVTRMLWYNPMFGSIQAVYGSRLFLQDWNLIVEVYDFGRADCTDFSPNQGDAESQGPTALRWLVEQDEHWFQGVLHTKLPFVHRVLTSPGTGQWDSMYVDQRRIIGIQDNIQMDVLYIG